MLTIFTLPKPFTGHSAIIQRNAIQSWLRLQPKPQVILCGQDEGIADTTREFGLQHIADIPTNNYGTPLISATFAQAQAAAHSDLVCYINCDIILLQDFISAIQSLHFKEYLMVGRRWNLDIQEPLNFSAPECENDLRRKVDREGSLMAPTGSDYFVFFKHTLGEMPPFVVGRPGWDNWMIYNARIRGLPVVDATAACLAIHQNHDYRHVHNAYQANAYEGPEADHNLKLMGGNRTRFNITDATYVLRNGRTVPALGPQHLVRRVRTLAVMHPSLRSLTDKLKRLSKPSAG